MPDPIYDGTTSLAAFLTAAAARQPTPGGGSVAALAGALAASMAEMVINYSVNKKDLQQYRAELDSALAEFQRGREILQQLMVEDQAAFAALTAARKSDGPGSAAFEAALLASIRVPQAIGATAVALLALADRIAGKVNKHLLSDLAVCGDLATATARCASYNIRANLPDVIDMAEREKLSSDADKLVQRAVEIVRGLSQRIGSIVGDST